MTSNRFIAIALSAVALLLGACQKQQQTAVADNSKVVATINDQTITENEMKHYMQLRQQPRDPAADPVKERKEVLDEMIDRALLAQRARATGVDKDPDVQYTLRRLQENILVHAMVQQMLKDNPITDEEVKQRFEKESKETHPTEYLVRHILVKDEDDAKELIGELKGKIDFAATARRKSIDIQTGKNGGSLGWVNQGTVPPELFEAITKVKKGSVGATPVKSDFGWHIIKVDDTRTAKIPTFDEFMANRQAKENFYRKLRDEKIENVLKELRNSPNVKIHEP